MFNLDVKVDAQSRTITINGINSKNIPGVIVSIPDENINRKQYISLFLHRADIIVARDFANEVSEKNDLIMNEALFTSTLVYFFRCFQRCEKRNALKLEDLVFVDEQSKADFQLYRSVRDRHYAHDENSMTQTYDFLLLTSIEGVEYDRIEACVVYHRFLPDFKYHADRMLSVIDQVILSIERLIDIVAVDIANEYKKVPISQVLAFTQKAPQFANMEGAFNKRPD